MLRLSRPSEVFDALSPVSSDADPEWWSEGATKMWVPLYANRDFIVLAHPNSHFSPSPTEVSFHHHQVMALSWTICLLALLCQLGNLVNIFGLRQPPTHHRWFSLV